MGNVSHPTKEPIHLKSCVLFPPNPQAPLPTTRERPLGCKTVFVGGLAENITGIILVLRLISPISPLFLLIQQFLFSIIAEEILREIFERCGSILTIRMSKKNFAHVRFERECFVDTAILLSGMAIH